MIPASVLDYLNRVDVPYDVISHPRAVSAPELARVLGLPGERVCKAVGVELDGQPWIAALPATERVSLVLLKRALGVERARLLREAELASLFPGCEVGAEPPFGGLYGLPVVADRSLQRQSRMVVRAGSHTECIELSTRHWFALEAPRRAHFGATPLPSCSLEERY